MCSRSLARNSSCMCLRVCVGGRERAREREAAPTLAHELHARSLSPFPHFSAHSPSSLTHYCCERARARQQESKFYSSYMKCGPYHRLPPLTALHPTLPPYGNA